MSSAQIDTLACKNPTVPVYMPDRYKIHPVRASVLNLLSQHEQGSLSDSRYKIDAANISVNRLQKFNDSPLYNNALREGGEFRFLRNGSRGDLIGVGMDDRGRRRGSIGVLKFSYNSLCDHDSSSENEESLKHSFFIRHIGMKYSYVLNLQINDTADLSFQNQKALLIAGDFTGEGSSAILTSYHDGHVKQEYEWRYCDPIFCCAGVRNSSNFALGCSNGFYTCENFLLTRHSLQGKVIAADFNSNGSLLLISCSENGIQLCDMRENFEGSCQNFQPFVKAAAMDDSPLIAHRMKLLSDQVTLVVSDIKGYISKVDLRMKKTVFQYPGHESCHSNRPLSIDEDLDLLCAVGKDSHYRIWSLCSGKLHWADEMPSQNHKDAAHACIVSSDRRWFVAVVQNRHLSTIVPGDLFFD